MKKIIWGSLAVVLAVTFVAATTFMVSAQQQKRGNAFSLEISPVTLIGEVKPGQEKKFDLTIKNNGVSTENLQLGLRDFDVDDETGEITPKDTEPIGIPEWVNFSEPNFKLEPGKKITQKVIINMPKETGFTYSFAIQISRVNDPQAKRGTSLAGRVLVFALISVDKPGAVRKFEVVRFQSAKGVYEYMPAAFEATFKNTGNTFVQPFGDIFIKQGKKQIASLPVNDKESYLLPGKNRTLYATWEGGFPEYKLVTDPETGEQKKELVWDWSKLAQFRMGQFTAKMVAVYNDGQRDIPVYAETTFWVFPWRIVLFSLAVLAVFIIGIVTIWKNVYGRVKNSQISEEKSAAKKKSKSTKSKAKKSKKQS